MSEPEDLEFQPVTPERWEDLTALFGKSGAYSGCWCMWWRQTQAEFARGAGEANRDALKAIVDGGRVPGLLAYRTGQPVGWCSVAPREEFGRLQRSPVLRPVDDQPVWAIVCFFVHRRHRGQGVGAALLRAAVRYAAEQGAAIVEGYPVDPEPERGWHPAAYFTGLASTFLAAGFEEVARRRPGRPIMRYRVTAVDRAAGSG